MTLIQHLQDAIETGELLTVVYHAGHAPGTKRKIVPRRLHEGLVYAKDFGDTPIKTYRLDRMELSSDNAPVPWMHEVTAKQKFEIIDAPAYFSEWEFEIHRALWPALGVTQREYIDKERTKAARVDAKQNGEANVSHIAIRYLAHAASEIPALDFHEGDLFAHKKNSSVIVQVISISEYIEVHQTTMQPRPQRHAFHVTDTELADWLRTGHKPPNARIGKGQSYSDVLRFSIEDPL